MSQIECFSPTEIFECSVWTMPLVLHGLSAKHTRTKPEHQFFVCLCVLAPSLLKKKINSIDFSPLSNQPTIITYRKILQKWKTSKKLRFCVLHSCVLGVFQLRPKGVFYQSLI